MGEALESHLDNTTFKRPLLSGVVYAKQVGPCKNENFERGKQWRIMHVTPESEPLPVQEEYLPSKICRDGIAYKDTLLCSLDMMTGKVPHLLFPLYTLYICISTIPTLNSGTCLHVA